MAALVFAKPRVNVNRLLNNPIQLVVVAVTRSCSCVEAGTLNKSLKFEGGKILHHCWSAVVTYRLRSWCLIKNGGCLTLGQFRVPSCC